MEAKVPVVPATVRQTEDGLSLCLGNESWPTHSIVESTQYWVDELEVLLRSNPEEWNFSLDKHWSRVLMESQAL
jgi:KDO2-lipid IV(A) lauroyltransferase